MITAKTVRSEWSIEKPRNGKKAQRPQTTEGSRGNENKKKREYKREWEEWISNPKTQFTNPSLTSYFFFSFFLSTKQLNK